MLWEVGEVRTGSLIPQVQGIRRKKKKMQHGVIFCDRKRTLPVKGMGSEKIRSQLFKGWITLSTGKLLQTHFC